MSLILLTVGRGEHTLHPPDKVQRDDFTKAHRPFYYKAAPCAIYHKTILVRLVWVPQTARSWPLEKTGHCPSKADILGWGPFRSFQESGCEREVSDNII